jgi:hypothetical protein
MRSSFLARFAALGLMIVTTGHCAEPAPVKVRVTAVSSDGSSKQVIEELVPTKFVGEYSQGDGLGCNLTLVLKQGGTFDCTWNGCLGQYGKSSGKWAVQADGLKLTALNAERMLKEQPVECLRVISLQNNYLLLEERHKDWFKDHGPDTFFCFHQAAARKALDDLWHKLLERIMKGAEEPEQSEITIKLLLTPPKQIGPKSRVDIGAVSDGNSGLPAVILTNVEVVSLNGNREDGDSSYLEERQV